MVDLGGITLINFLVIALLTGSLFVAYKYVPKSNKSDSYLRMTLLVSTISFALYKYITHALNNASMEF
jgi:hypothetical protein